MGKSRPVMERILTKVDVASSGCWEFTGARGSSGYGNVRVDDAVVSVHRVVYEHMVAPIPEGLQIDHLCRNRCCCNPDHLEPVTSRENTRRGHGPAGENARRDECSNGHAFDEQNTYVAGGRRACRQCTAERQRRYQDRKRASA